MKTVDSKKQELGIPEIISQSLEQLSNEDDPPIQAQMLSVAKEGSMESADTVQIGNTVFLAHRGKGENKNKSRQCRTLANSCNTDYIYSLTIT